MTGGGNRRPSRGGPTGKDRRRGLLGAILGFGALAGGLAFLMHRQPGAPRGVDPESLQDGYEVHDVRFGAMLGVIIALVAGILLVITVATVFESALTGRQGLFPFQTTITNPPKAQQPPAPQLETANGQVLDALRANEDKLLNDYTWIDQKAGTLRIPIERAIDLTAQRGLPTRAQTAATAGGSSLLGPSAASSGRQTERTSP